ncbi:MAG: LPXTG cell wall anchor domain-containing protein [Eubacteriaceae bacterium]|nr:LPXTG cell wall anchor domain-containing protein [Eubacteriaceae bacterium]
MKKRLVAFVFALALIFCALPLTPVHAYDPENPTPEESEFIADVKDIFTDPVLAEVVYTAILNSGQFDSTKTALQNVQAFEGDISYSGTDSKFIKDLTGIENFVHASISFTNQSLTDLSPMGNFSEETNKSIKVSNSPIHIWPVDFPDKAHDTFAVPTPFACSGHAVYLYNDTPKEQTVIYDVYTKSNGTQSPVPVDVDANTTLYVLSGGVSVKNGQTKPAANDTEVVFVVEKDGKGIAGIAYNALDYVTAGSIEGTFDPQKNNVSYAYTLDSKFYYTVKAESYTLGWFYLGKFDESDTDHEHPLGGAKFEIYNEEGTCIETVTTEEGKYTKVEGGPGGLPAGTYTIKEVEAPEDYLVSSETMTVTVPSVSGVTVSGGKDSLTVNDDSATWTPVWSTGFVENGGDTSSIELVTDNKQDVTAEDKGVDTFIANKSADQDAGFASGSNPFTITPDAGVSGGAVVTMGTTEVGTYGSIEAAQAAVRDLIANDKVTGNITITINADATSFPDEKAPFVYFMDKETPPQTGDSAMIIAAVVGLIAAGAGLVIFARKRVAKAN